MFLLNTLQVFLFTVKVFPLVFLKLFRCDIAVLPVWQARMSGS